MTLPAPLAPLARYEQFITYKLVPRPDGRTDKVPLDWRTGHGGSLMDPGNQTTYAEAAAAVAAGRGSGVGFVFTAADPFWFVDIDKALSPQGWSPVAAELYHALAGAAVEVSQSGTGLHIIGSGTPPEHGCKNTGLRLELYHTDRFVALTGNCYEGGSADAPLGAAIAGVAAKYFAPAAANPAGVLAGWTTEPVAEWGGPIDDAELLRKARSSRTASAAFGGVTFADLWDANAEVLGRKWPGEPYDASQADAALAAHLAFWTGKNCERIERLMRESALLRDKWDRKSAYLEPTILRACNAVRKVAAVREPVAVVSAPHGQTGQYVTASDYPGYFAGCTYVVAEDAIYTPRGDLLGSSQFNTVYGGHDFILDPEGRKTTNEAWTAFRTSRIWRCPIADELCFRPERPSGGIEESEGQRLLNTYVPIETLSIEGDPAPFLQFLRKLLPVERDRRILLTYMASMVQNTGRKFQWWVVLQGLQGNGKTLVLSALSHCIGHRYTHLVNPDAMVKTGNQFNDWIHGHLFIGIEEIYVNKRRDFLESFKSTVTNARLGLEAKGGRQYTGDNRANGMLCTNHKDGVPLSDTDRRYAILWTGQQHVTDLTRDGMTGSYFPNLYDWLCGREKHAYLGENYGYAVVNHYLRHMPLDPEFDPAGLCQRAPETSSTKSVLSISMGAAEQFVQEAIDEGRVGFAGGWVSSHYLDMLLEQKRLHVALHKRGELLRNLGYRLHDCLGDQGRATATVRPDGKRSRLWLREGHLALNVMRAPDIMDMYQQAQIGACGDATFAAPRAVGK